jgi:uncharacterized protein YndB with AHSA1/START domain
MSTQSQGNELKIIRVFDAPLTLVWEAWTDPAQVAQWWGPRGFTLTHHSKDLRPGGHWHYTMHGPDGVDYPSKTIYHEVVPHAKLVYDHGGNDDRPPLFRVTVLFSEADGRTTMDMTMTLPTPEAAEATRKFIKKAGGNATWDRLAEYLVKESSGREKFVINRSFAAPLDLMFKMWTDPAHFAQWLPPVGADMEFIRADIREGGSSFYCMTVKGGLKMYGRAEYLTIQRPDTIIYTQQFCDEVENVTGHPMAPAWPRTMLTTVKLTPEGPQQTRVTVVWEPHGAVTAEELAAFVAMKGSMTLGWTGSFDKLEVVVGDPSPTA